MKKNYTNCRCFEFLLQRKILRIMRLIFIFHFLALIQISASSFSQSRVSLDVKNYPLEKVFGEIEKQTDYRFLYDVKNVKNEYADVKSDDMPIDNLLDLLLANRNIDYKILSNNLIVITPVETIQRKTVTGTITDAVTGEPLLGVNVVLEGTTIGMVSDINGKYSLELPLQQGGVLVFSFIGYVTERVPVENRDMIDIKMVPDIKSLEEIVVVGYGTQKKATVTGSISAVGTKDLLQSPQANISNALVGRMPGLLSVQRSGQPGADQSTLRIRGIGTFTGSADPLVMVDGIETDNYNNIDQNEIESVSILKDASATAVYGVRGANGVLIITTKRGKEGKPKISYSSQYAVSRFTDIRHFMNSYDYARSYNEGLKYDGFITGTYTPKFSDAAIEHYRTGDDPIFYPDVDWFDYMFNKTSGQWQHNININGGTENVKYFASVGYFNQEGLINHLDDIITDYDAQLRYKRYNIRTNFDFNITKRLSASINLSSQIENRSGTTADINRVFESTYATNPVDHPKIVDGKYLFLDNMVSGGVHPLGWLLTSGGYGKNYRNYLNGSVQLNYQLDFILKGLKARANVSYNNYNEHRVSYTNILVTYKANRLSDGSASFIPQGDPQPFSFGEGFNKNRKIYAETGLEYANKFGDHNVGALLLYNQSKRYDPDYLYLVPNAYQGIVGRVTYDYKNRYLAELNIGYNGTEQFAEGKRFGFFPAYSLGWVASDEPFFPQNNIFTYLKIRGSYGEVGNDKIGSIKISEGGKRFLYLPSAYTATNNFYYFGTNGSDLTPYAAYLEGPLGNPLLTWEKAKKTNIGAEFHFLKDRIQGNIDFFQEKRENILANPQTIPNMTGVTLPAKNLGRMSNHGFEGDISYNQTIGKLDFWVKFNYTFTDNKIEYMNEVPNAYGYMDRTGRRFGQTYGFIANGFFETWEEANEANRPVYALQPGNKIQPGDIKYVDINGDGQIDSNDQTAIGYSPFPGKIFGLSFGARYRGFDFSCLFQGAGNVTVQYHRSFTTPFNDGRNAADYFLESWSQERRDQGLPVNFPRFSWAGPNNPNNTQASTFWIRDASYLRLKNIELGYNFPSGLLKRVGMSDLRLYVNGSNLYTWSDMLPGADPESTEFQTGSTLNNAPYPVTSTVNFGINVKF